MATFKSKEESAKDQVPLHHSQERIGAFRATVQMIANRTGSELWTFEKLQASLCTLVSLSSHWRNGSSINFWRRSGGGYQSNDIRCRNLWGWSRHEEEAEESPRPPRQCSQWSGGLGGPTGKLPRRLDRTGWQFLLRPVLGHFRTAGFEQGPQAPQGETLLCHPNKRTTGDGSGLQIPW